MCASTKISPLDMESFCQRQSLSCCAAPQLPAAFLTPATAAASRRRPRTCTPGGSPDGTAPACARAARRVWQGTGKVGFRARVKSCAAPRCSSNAAPGLSASCRTVAQPVLQPRIAQHSCAAAPPGARCRLQLSVSSISLPTCASPSSEATSFTMRTVCRGRRADGKCSGRKRLELATVGCNPVTACNPSCTNSSE